MTGFKASSAESRHAQLLEVPEEKADYASLIRDTWGGLGRRP
jgi:hypothetical protein